MGRRFKRYQAQAIDKITARLHPSESILHTVTGSTIPSGPSGAYGVGPSGHAVLLAVTDRHLFEVPMAQQGFVVATRWFHLRDLKIRRRILGYRLQFATVYEYPHDRGEARITHNYIIDRSASTRPFLGILQKESSRRSG